MIDVGNDRKITNKILILHKFLFYDDAGSNLIDFICQTFAVLKTAKVSSRHSFYICEGFRRKIDPYFDNVFV